MWAPKRADSGCHVGLMGPDHHLAKMINLKRAYVKPEKQDGFRVLVERLWPRGLKKEAVALDLWLKDVAPSPGLRRWFGHDPARWEEFCRRYWIELAEQPAAIKVLREKLSQGNVTLVYGSRDQEHNAAVALKEFLEKETSDS